MSAGTRAAFAIVHLPVLERGAIATYVAHRSAQEWFVGGPGFGSDEERRFRRVDLAAVRDVLSEASLLDLRVGEHAFRHADDQPWQRGKIPVGRTFLVSYEVRLTAPSAEWPGIGGAYANCWVVCASSSAAKQMAAEQLEGDGWVIVDERGAKERFADDLAEGTEPYFRQVQIDGFVTVFHTFPADDPDVS